MPGKSGRRSGWTFLTSHARVLLALARDPEARLRDVAETCGITERTAQAIVADLEAGGYLTRTRAADGRRNRYRIDTASPFRHPAEGGREIAGLLELLAPRTEHAPASLRAENAPPPPRAGSDSAAPRAGAVPPAPRSDDAGP